MKEADRTVELLFEKKLSIASAESCTGGMIAAELVNYSGISELFSEGYVTYSNDAKVRNLKVGRSTLDTHGAVSREVASEMAHGARLAAGSDIGIATTGIAGPDGGTEEKPVGLVYIGCEYRGRITVRKFIFKGGRYQVRHQALKEAFRLIYDVIKTYDIEGVANAGDRRKKA